MSQSNPRKTLYIKPTAAAVKAARKGIQARRAAPKSKRGGLDTRQAKSEGVGSGVARARDIIAGRRVNAYQIKAFFDRHRQNYLNAKIKGLSPEESKAIQAWLLWGGEPLRKQAEREVSKHKKEAAKENPNLTKKEMQDLQRRASQEQLAEALGYESVYEWEEERRMAKKEKPSPSGGARSRQSRNPGKPKQNPLSVGDSVGKWTVIIWEPENNTAILTKDVGANVENQLELNSKDNTITSFFINRTGHIIAEPISYKLPPDPRAKAINKIARLELFVHTAIDHLYKTAITSLYRAADARDKTKPLKNPKKNPPMSKQTEQAIHDNSRKWIDAQKLAKQHPDSFDAPDINWLQNTIQTGDLVKWNIGNERLWLIVLFLDKRKVTGLIDNKPITPGYSFNDIAKIELRHIYDYKKGNGKSKKRANTFLQHLSITNCHTLWEVYCKKPSIAKLRAVVDSCDVLKMFKTKQATEERKRCMKSIRAEARARKWKL